MLLEEFEHMVPASARAKTVHALEIRLLNYQKFGISYHHKCCCCCYYYHTHCDYDYYYYYYYYYYYSVVGIATSYGLDDRGVGVRVPVGSRIFTSPNRPDWLWGPPNLLSNEIGRAHV
jgi:hypothetical protein